MWGKRGRNYNTKLLTIVSYLAIVVVAVVVVVVVVVAAGGGVVQAAYAWNFDADGDWGCSTRAAETVKKIQSQSPERVLALGDLSYQSTADCWFNLINPFISKTRIAIGNHDDTSSTLLNQYLDRFHMNHQYHAFDYSNAHFLILSTEQVSSSTQLSFAKKDLAAAAADSGTDWIIVMMHRPLYTSPNLHGAEAAMRDKYHPLFDQYGVDLVLYGHNHSYERSYPLKYDKVSPSSPIIASKETTTYATDPKGPIFMTIGTGGQSLYDYSGKASYIIKQQDDRFGFLDVSISGTHLRAKYFTINSDSIVVADTFTITK